MEACFSMCMALDACSITLVDIYLYNIIYLRAQPFFCSGIDGKYFRLCVDTVSVATVQLYHDRMKATTDDMKMNGYGYVPIKFIYRKRQPLQFSP